MEDIKTPTLKQALISLRATIVLTLITGLAFPALLMLCAQLLFPFQANGSLVLKDGKVIGSKLIGQSFKDPKYFHPRPSAAGNGYAGESSSGTNLGPTSGKLINGDKDFAGIKQLAEQYIKENSLPVGGRVPVDAVTRSASGLDPDISPENATLQAQRVANARHLDAIVVGDLVAQHIEPRQWGLFGEPHINVLSLNVDLDKLEATEKK